MLFEDPKKAMLLGLAIRKIGLSSMDFSISVLEYDF
jgi:hypothetical protein